MFERYTEQARRSLFFARYEASVLGSLGITPDHLLLGILREGQDIADLVPPRVAESIRAAILQRTTERPRVATDIEIPFSREAKDVLKAAAAEADTLLHAHIGPEHLLLALIAVEGNGADAVLTTQGFDPEALRRQIRERPSTATPGSPPTPANPATLTPAARREASIRQLDAMATFVRSFGDEHARTPESKALVEQICRDLAALKSSVSNG